MNGSICQSCLIKNSAFLVTEVNKMYAKNQKEHCSTLIAKSLFAFLEESCKMFACCCPREGHATFFRVVIIYTLTYTFPVQASLGEIYPAVFLLILSMQYTFFNIFGICTIYVYVFPFYVINDFTRFKKLSYIKTVNKIEESLDLFHGETTRKLPH